jgi:hypothetical protein
LTPKREKERAKERVREREGEKEREKERERERKKERIKLKEEREIERERETLRGVQLHNRFHLWTPAVNNTRKRESHLFWSTLSTTIPNFVFPPALAGRFD